MTTIFRLAKTGIGTAEDPIRPDAPLDNVGWSVIAEDTDTLTIQVMDATEEQLAAIQEHSV